MRFLPARLLPHQNLHPSTPHSPFFQTPRLSIVSSDRAAAKQLSVSRSIGEFFLREITAAAASASCNQFLRPYPNQRAAAAATMAPFSKVTTKSFYDLGKKECKTRLEGKFADSDIKVGANISDQQGLVGLDLDRGALKVGYDVKRRDLALQFTHKGDGGSTIKVRQVVPGMKWEVVPTPVVELSTRLLDQGKWRDSLKLTYDFMNRNAYYMETLKFDKRFKVRVAGDSNSASHAFCLGYKPDERWVKSVKLLHTPAQGPILSYKLKPAAGWKVANEAAPRIKTVFSSVTYKALQGDAEFALDVALPWDKGLSGLTSGRLTKRAGLRVDFAF